MSAKLLSLILSAALASGAGAVVTETVAGAPGTAAAQLVDAVASRHGPSEALNEGDEHLVLRICLGPANVTFGGDSPVSVSFHAGGCGDRLFGLALVSARTQRPSFVF